MKGVQKVQLKKRATLTNIPKSTAKASFEGFLAGRITTNKSEGVGHVVIRTYVPEINDEDTRKRVFDIAKQYYSSNREASAIVFGKDVIEPSVQILWPICKINNLFTQQDSTSTTEVPTYESKFIGASFKNPMSTSDSDLTTYYFYRENDLCHLIEISKLALLDVVKKGKEYLEYLRSIDKTFIAVGENLPMCPPLHVLQEFDGSRRLIMQIDQPSSRRSSKETRISPTISIRYMRLSGVSRNGSPPYWYYEKIGMTLSAANFFFMIESAIQNYLFRIEHTVKCFGNEYFASEEKMEIYSKENLTSWDMESEGKGTADDDEGDDVGYAMMKSDE